MRLIGGIVGFVVMFSVFGFGVLVVVLYIVEFVRIQCEIFAYEITQKYRCV